MILSLSSSYKYDLIVKSHNLFWPSSPLQYKMLHINLSSNYQKISQQYKSGDPQTFLARWRWWCGWFTAVVETRLSQGDLGLILVLHGIPASQTVTQHKPNPLISIKKRPWHRAENESSSCNPRRPPLERRCVPRKGSNVVLFTLGRHG